MHYNGYSDYKSYNWYKVMLGYFVVKGQSMEPLYKEGDFVLLDKLSYFVFRPRAGDVVVLRHPQEENRLLLKYVIKEKLEGNRFFYWVEGVNKEGSSDSRTFGWVPRELILGKALIISGPRTRPAISALRI